jgi:hypothetical protein
MEGPDMGKESRQTKERPSRYAMGPMGRVFIGDKITLALSPEASEMLNQLLNLTDDSPDDLFRKSLGLYKAAQDAHKEDKAVGVATSPDVLETEFVGF